MTGLVALTADARQDMDAERVTHQLAATVPDALGSSANVTYGIGAGR
jgi:hypothetical protein